MNVCSVPHTIRSKAQSAPNRRTQSRIPDWVTLFDPPNKQSSEEDPYSLPANGSSYDSGYYANNGTLMKRSTIKESKPPKLPPRDFGKYKANTKPTTNKKNIEIPTPDYSQEEDFYTITEKSLKKMPFCDRGIH